MAYYANSRNIKCLIFKLGSHVYNLANFAFGRRYFSQQTSIVYLFLIVDFGLCRFQIPKQNASPVSGRPWEREAGKPIF